MLQSLNDESSSVSSFFQSVNLNSSSFLELGDLMTDLGGDEVELDEYFSILFNNTQATELLAISVGSNLEAKQNVIDALEGDQKVSILLSIVRST